MSLSFSDGTTTDAEVVGKSASYDLAVLRVDAKNLPALPLGNSDSVVVGDPVIAIGSPLGLSGTVTSGIISAKNRPVTAGEEGDDSSYINAIQTDAAINPGNSGGPLVNLDGEVIGVNSAIATVGQSLGGEGGNIGVGFAIPINQVRRTVEQIIDTGEAQFPIIGASLDGSYDGRGRAHRDGHRQQRHPADRSRWAGRGGRPPAGRRHPGAGRQGRRRQRGAHRGDPQPEPRRHHLPHGAPGRLRAHLRGHPGGHQGLSGE